MSPDPRDRRRSRLARKTPAAPGDAVRRRTGRHPDAEFTVVRLTDPAVDDLIALNRLDPQILRWALRKMLLLETDPEAGEPLVGDLIGWRKLTVGDRDWRIVWRVTHDDTGTVVVDVAEVWAAGARSDSEVYAEMSSRVAGMPDAPHTSALKDVLAKLAVAGMQARDEPVDETHREPLPGWLRTSLRDRVGLSEQTINELSLDDAIETWNAWMARPR